MNKTILIGRLTKDPEVRFTPGNGTAVCNFTLAVDNYNSKTGEHGADFIPIVVWGKMAEACGNYLHKGSQVAIDGRISTRSYDAKDGTKRYVTEVVANAFGGVQFLDSKNSGNNNGNNNRNNNENTGNNVFEGNNFDEDITPVDDGDMPF